MARMAFSGLEEYMMELKKLELLTVPLIDAAIQAGANVIADAVRVEIAMLPQDNRPGKVKEGELRKGPTGAQVKGMLDSLGITPLQEKNGYYDRKIGFDGYNWIRTERWPKGQPNNMVARSVNNGTSFMVKNPFMDKTVRKMRKYAEQAMMEAADKFLEEARNRR